MDISFLFIQLKLPRFWKFKKKVAQIQSQINIESEKGLARNPELEMAHRNVEDLRDKLQEGVEKVFKFGLYVNVYAKDLETLEKMLIL